MSISCHLYLHLSPLHKGQNGYFKKLGIGRKDGVSESNCPN